MSEQDYGRWWDRVAGDFDEALTTTYEISDRADYCDRGRFGDANTPGAEQLFAMGQLTAQSRVLEIGCGIARVGREMAPKVGEWHGADVSARLLGFAAERLEGLDNVSLHQLDGLDLSAVPVQDFDFIYSTTTFAHLDKEDVFAYLLECGRLLRPGGRLYVDTWNLDHADSFRLWRSVQSVNRGANKERGRYQCSTEAELRRYLGEAGFAIEHFAADRLLKAVARFEGPALHDPHDGAPPFGYVSLPANLQEVESALLVDGWVLDDVRRVEIRIDGADEVHLADLGLPRPDVADIFPRFRDAGSCGFRVQISVEDLAAGRHLLEVEAVDGDGRRQRLTGYHRAFLCRHPTAGDTEA